MIKATAAKYLMRRFQGQLHMKFHDIYHQINIQSVRRFYQHEWNNALFFELVLGHIVKNNVT